MKLNIAVFFGGETVEHEVSIISALQAMRAMNNDKYEIYPVYITKDRTMYTSPLLADIRSYRNIRSLLEECEPVGFVRENGKVMMLYTKQGLFKKKAPVAIDCAVPVMHGTNGEDGTIQGFLEALKLPYAGCDVIAAGIGQDKVLQKHILHDAGIPVTDWFWCYGEAFDDDQEAVMERVRKIGYPVILKPARTGSSIGISIAHNDEEYIECFEEARQYDEKVITEKVIKPMIELNCSVLGDSYKAKPSVLEQVGHGSANELLDFRDKYQGGGAKKTGNEESQGMASAARIVPAPIPDDKTEEIRDLACKIFRTLGAAGVCRIDFMMNSETGEIYANEINTIPGSLAFYLWEATGMRFAELMDELIRLALDRARRKERMTFSYDTNLLETYSESSAKGAKGAKR